ncbi:MAG: anti-sigma factor domain-containing protein, partial [Eubacteriales bacterium]
MKERSRAVVVEIRGSSAAVLTGDGSYVRVPDKGYSVGQEILLKRAARPVIRRARLTALATAAAAFLLLFGGFTSYAAPAGVVSLDVNPSIEYTINCFDIVLDATAVNGDAGLILAAMDERTLRFRPVDEAVEATIAQLRESGYLTLEQENDVVISASSYSYRHAERITERLSERVRLQNDLTVYSVTVERNKVQNAHDLGTSAGKFYLIERLGESIGQNDAFDPTDWVETPVREIIAEMKGKPGAPESDNSAKGSAAEQPDGKQD